MNTKLRTATATAFALALTFAATAQARDYDNRGYKDRNYDYTQRDARHADRLRDHRSKRDHHVARSQPIELRLDVRSNGANRIALRRLIRQQHGIDTRDYRIRSVAIRNKNRYDACADLVVGHRSTGPVALRRGVTHIKAPGGRRAADGRWALNVDAARVRGIAVVLEPKRRVASYRPGYSRDRYLARSWY